MSAFILFAKKNKNFSDKSGKEIDKGPNNS